MKLLLFAAILALVFRLSVMEDFRVVSNSMEPSLTAGDIIFVSKSSYSLKVPFSSIEIYRLGTPHRGDIVTFGLPDFPGKTFVKRVVALEGDRIEIKEGRLILNDQPMSYLKVANSDLKPTVLQESMGVHSYPVLFQGTPSPNYGPVDVPKGHFFTIGDNRFASVDSREWGPIPMAYLKGKAKWGWLLNSKPSSFFPQIEKLL